MTNDFGKKIRGILKIISYGILLLIGLFSAYIAYISWEVSEIKQLCREAVPGTTISEMKSLISKNGGNWYKAASVKIKDEPNMWVETVCAKSTMCEVSCRIYHNEIEVVEATHGVRTDGNASKAVAPKIIETNGSLDKMQLNNPLTISRDKNNNSSVKHNTTGKAIFSRKNAYVSFWQTNYLSGNQGGCTMEFMFGSNTLTIPIEELTFKVHLLDKNGKKLGKGSFSLLEPIGGSLADSYRTSVFNGIRIKNPKEDGEYSPLCLTGVSIVFDEAIGMQGGNKVELVRYNQLRYTKMKSINVRIKKTN